MKSFLFFVSVLITMQAMSQTVFDIVEKLDRARLISSYEKKEFIKERKAREEHWKKMNREGNVRDWELEIMDEPHYPLTVLLQLKMHSTAGTRSALMFHQAPVEIKKSEEKRIINYLEQFANKLYNAALISAKTLNDLLPQIRNLNVRSEYEVTAFAGERTEKEYFLTPKRLKKFADQLLSKELISDQDYKEINAKTEAGEFRDYIEILRYLKNLVIINTNEYSGKLEEYLEEIYRKTATALPTLDFDSLQFSIVTDKRESSPVFRVFNMEVTLKKQDNTYRYASFFDAEYKNKKKEDVSKIPERYYEIFNKILADQGSPYRLHQVSLHKDYYGVLAMTKNQFEGLQWSYSGMNHGGYINLSYENFTNKITQAKIKEAVGVYDSIGLLSHLSSEKKDSCIREIESREINYYSDILSSFKDLVFEIDLEYGVGDGQYREITKLVSAISNERFNPTDIIDTYNYEKRKSFDYGFTLNVKKYSTKLHQEDDWLDLGFWELIEKAVAEQDNNGKFYYLYPADGMRQIYLTNEQVKILKQRKMIELDENDIENL
jgi:hypothetical protein